MGTKAFKCKKEVSFNADTGVVIGVTGKKNHLMENLKRKMLFGASNLA
jgi:hypothetical protein